MSIIQVMDSSKSGRTVYVVASSLITVAFAYLVTSFQGSTLQLTVENALVLIPIVGGISLLLLSVELERHVIEWLSLHRINGKKEMKEVKLKMAEALLYVAPWESSTKDANSINTSLTYDLKRMLRSPQFSEQIAELKQVFWILFLLPFTIIVAVFIYGFDLIPIGAIITLGLASSSLIHWKNRKILNRIISYTYANWFLEGTSADLERRNASVRKKSRHKDRLVSSLELTKPVIDLAVKGDWDGFDRKSRNLDDLVGIPGYDALKWNLVEEYVEFLEWCATRIHGIYSSHIDIFLNNAALQISSAISVLNDCRDDSFDEEEERVAKTLYTLSDISKDKETLLSIDVEFFEILDTESLKKLKEGYLEILGKLPFRMKEIDPPGVNSEARGLDRLSWLVANAGENDILDRERSLRAVVSWGTPLTTIMSAVGPLTIKMLLEVDVGFPIDQLSSVAHTIREEIKQDDIADPSKVLSTLCELKRIHPKESVRKYAEAIQWDSKRSPDGQLHNAIQAITEFINNYHKY